MWTANVIVRNKISRCIWPEMWHIPILLQSLGYHKFLQLCCRSQLCQEMARVSCVQLTRQPTHKVLLCHLRMGAPSISKGARAPPDSLWEKLLPCFVPFATLLRPIQCTHSRRNVELCFSSASRLHYLACPYRNRTFPSACNPIGHSKGRERTKMILCDPAFRQLSTHKSWSDRNGEAWGTAVPYTQRCLQEQKKGKTVHKTKTVFSTWQARRAFSKLFLFSYFAVFVFCVSRWE